MTVAKEADLAGPGIGDYAELERVLPRNYAPLLDPKETMQALYAAKRLIEDRLCEELGLTMVQVPLIVDSESGVNDYLDRDGSRTPVTFHISNDREQHPIEEEVAPLYAFFPPFFFAFIGLQLTPGEYTSGRTLALLAAVTVVAVVTKFAGSWLGARSLGRREATIVGAGMVPRGEVGIVIAGVALAEDAVSSEFFAIVVGMSVVTTLLAPPVLRAVSRPASQS
jgi:hypothetical protein